ncbi:MAG: alanine--tRNA ligase, partial [Candidatus Levybacteria bacterium]|nr:alanine--tRNA ligase [Candidatus Levybacteria bacterium]
MTASEIIQKYIEFFEKRGHVRIPNSPLVPENDPTTLFTSSGMQPLVPYLLGEPHPQGKKLVNVQNSFRAQDIDEIGDNRHTTFFRMLGNWSLGDYFKKEEIPWLFEFLTKQLNIDPKKLYITVFDGFGNIGRDTESEKIWRELFESVNLNPDGRIFFYGADNNWWSRAGEPKDMPVGEPGGPDTEVFYQFDAPHDEKFGKTCHPNCQCGRFLEIANSVFMQYKKIESGFEELPQKNVDFGGGLERLVAATENQQDIFQTSLFSPIIETIENTTAKEYNSNQKEMRIVADHLIASAFIIVNNVRPSNKEQGYILRRLLRRSFDNFYLLNGEDFTAVIERIVDLYKDTDDYLIERFENIKNTILEEMQVYEPARTRAQREYLSKIHPLPGKVVRMGDEIMGDYIEITPREAFNSLATYGTAPIQLESLGYKFDRQGLAELIKQHQAVSRAGEQQKFAGGLADHSALTIKGHTATHLLHQALRDVLGDSVHQTGSNITTDRIRFDFNYARKLTEDEIRKVEEVVNKKIKENLPVHFEIMPVARAKEIGAIGLFDEKYQDKVKIYFIGPSDARGPVAPHPRPTSSVANAPSGRSTGVPH